MKRITLLALGACLVAPALAETSVGVSIGISQPGVYGRIDIGNYPQPRFVNVQPVLIAPPPRYVTQKPIYLYVPPGHQKNWAKHCGRYNACGHPVYFVREDWIQERWDDHRHHGDDRGRGDDRGDERHGKGHGKGHGRGRD